MKLTSLHLLLTFQCTFECDHCFVWGSPRQKGTMTMVHIQEIIRQAVEYGGVDSIYFEGGEPFLFYPILVKGVQAAARQGFHTGIVSNAFWATNFEDAIEWLKPMAGLLHDLSVSSDLFHWDERISQNVKNACKAAETLGIPIGTIEVCPPDDPAGKGTFGQIPEGASSVMYRGRAAEKLVGRAVWQPWAQFDKCPHENLEDIGRAHLDPFGNLHACQGISFGNIFEKSIKESCDSYSAITNPITGPLAEGGPVALVNLYGLPHLENYADACHLCYTARLSLRERYPEILKPDQMYGGF